MEQLSIMIIEDEAIVAEDIAARLDMAGYRIASMVDNGEDAIEQYRQLRPDMVMADIHLKGNMDGIQTVTKLNAICPTLVVYLTAFADDRTWERAKQTRPSAYLTKPFRERDVYSAIELAISRHNEVLTDRTSRLNDRYFIRTGNGRFEKIMLDELLYLEADRSYCQIVTRHRRYTLSEPLNQLHAKIGNERLVRIHRSFVVNVMEIQAIDHHMVVINGESLPIGQAYEADFFTRINGVR